MEKIWFKDIKNFMSKDNFLIFFPSSDMELEEQLNSILRLSIYFSVLMMLYSRSLKYIYIVIFTMLITTGMYYNNAQKEKKKEQFYKNNNLALSKNENKKCLKPTQDNPFMNVLVNELEEGEGQRMAEACDVQNEYVKEEMLDKFNEKLYRSADDVFLNHASDRQFYTMPVTDIINDQTEFAKWLYDRPSCKGGNYKQCHKNVSSVILGKVG